MNGSLGAVKCKHKYQSPWILKMMLVSGKPVSDIDIYIYKFSYIYISYHIYAYIRCIQANIIRRHVGE